MFYCDECAKKNKWPGTFSRSRGSCEVCGEIASCNDLPSSYLPAPPRPVDKFTALVTGLRTVHFKKTVESFVAPEGLPGGWWRSDDVCNQDGQKWPCFTEQCIRDIE